MSTIQFHKDIPNSYEDFSNFAHTPFQTTEYGQTVHFPTVEHYFHDQKTKLFSDENAKQAILNANDPPASQTYRTHRSKLRPLHLR